MSEKITPKRDIASPPKKHEFSTPIRSKCIYLIRKNRRDSTLSNYNSVTSFLRKEGVLKSAAYKWERKDAERQTSKKGSTKRGRKSALDSDTLDFIEAYIVQGGFPTRAQHWEEIRDELSIPVCPRTLKNAFHARGYDKYRAAQSKYLKPWHVTARLSFCYAYILYSITWWKRVRFTDEVHVCLTTCNTKWVIRCRTERFEPNCMQFKHKRASSIFHIWSMIGQNYKHPLVFYGEGVGKGNINTERYVKEILGPHVLPACEEVRNAGEGFILEEDNDGGHGIRSKKNLAAKFKDIYEIPYYANPANSPNLIPIENAQRILKQRTKKRNPKVDKQLKAALISVQAEIAQAKINELIKLMPSRLMECINKDGRPTRY